MLRKKWKELAIGVVFLILSAAGFAYTFTFVNRVSTDVGPAYMPRIICVLLGVLALLKIVQTLLTPVQQTGDSGDSSDDRARKKSDFFTGVLTIAAIAAYIFLLRIIGFIPCTIAYIFVQSTLFAPDGTRSLPVRIGMSLILPIVLYYLFVYGFNLMLPTGTIW